MRSEAVVAQSHSAFSFELPNASGDTHFPRESEMAAQDLENRVIELERQMADVQRKLEASHPVKDWRRTFGMFANDPVFEEIVELGREYREEQNQADAE
jgi:hypothetical protein